MSGKIVWFLAIPFNRVVIYIPSILKYLIAGLGNIGAEYERTRHNIGFAVVDALAASADVTFSSERKANVAEMRFRGRTVFLIKPTTYMNLSGEALNYWMQKESIKLENILVITDDLALPFGSLRLRQKGSSAGHNGLTNIIECLKTDAFARLRFGIGNNFGKGHQVNYVLSEWNTDEKKLLPERIDAAVEITKSFVAVGVNLTMNQFNNK